MAFDHLANTFAVIFLGFRVIIRRTKVIFVKRDDFSYFYFLLDRGRAKIREIAG